MANAIPPGTLNPSEGSALFVTYLNDAISSSLKKLMESKGLYQSIEVSRSEALKEARSKVHPNLVNDFDRVVRDNFPADSNWLLAGSPSTATSRDGTIRNLLCIIPNNYKLFCSKCEREEAFKPIWSQDITTALTLQNLGSKSSALSLPIGFQMFALVYECQSCQGPPESFLIRRTNLKIAMHGRSPIESITVPNYIPETESKWYRESAIARKFGRPLAAIFYLRVFIEQFARRVTGITERRPGEEILSEYSGTISDPPRNAMPSLREWYGTLSEAIHSANEDEKMLAEALEAVSRHFEFRKLYRISEAPAPRKEPEPNAEESGTSR